MKFKQKLPTMEAEQFTFESKYEIIDWLEGNEHVISVEYQEATEDIRNEFDAVETWGHPERLWVNLGDEGFYDIPVGWWVWVQPNGWISKISPEEIEYNWEEIQDVAARA